MYYTQLAWDQLLTKDSGGYPLTEVEMNVLGLAAGRDSHPRTRDYIEKNSGIMPQVGYMIVNDLKTFGFLEETDQAELALTSTGEDALNGIARRIYEKKFIPGGCCWSIANATLNLRLRPPKGDHDTSRGPQIDLF